MNNLEELVEAARNFEVSLSSEAVQKAKDFIDLLIAKNAKVNLTAETDENALYLRHLADGFPAAKYLRGKLPSPARVADLGSGGGFIGFGLKLAWPEAEVTLIEALQRKYDFLNVAVLRSGLKGLRVVKARAGKQLAAGGFDAVVERALAPLPYAVPMAAKLLKPGGLFVAYQSDPPDLAEPSLAKALVRAPMTFVDIMTYRLPREDRDRFLAAFRKGD
jgi:16S rRNA (guanine527-N7)-methyltransferase